MMKSGTGTYKPLTVTEIVDYSANGEVGFQAKDVNCLILNVSKKN